ncbi:type II secretion system protein J [Nocardioides sp.]|uniref:PulJ/GspJ family protein n=1 Tax=Nocardioides sp. TaxID=35761 RepID=UPI003565697C
MTPHDRTHDPLAEPEHRDRGLSLAEVLVTMGLFGLLSTLLLGFAVSTSRVTTTVRDSADVTEESRLAVERMSRELRQANAVDRVDLRNLGGATTTALTLWSDFNGNGVRDNNAADPEVLTYRWDPGTGRLTLTANDAAGTAVTRPILAEVVSAFTLRLRSSLWEYDANGDGVTTWQELDSAGAPVGNSNGLPDGPELERIDLVAVSLGVTEGKATREFYMQVDLRNRAQN